MEWRLGVNKIFGEGACSHRIEPANANQSQFWLYVSDVLHGKYDSIADAMEHAELIERQIARATE